jgi:hypothetical protein
MLGQRRCLTVGAKRIDAAVGHELLRAVEPLAIEAALQAEHRYIEMQSEQRRIIELELQQARYEASLAERRYAACDPDNRLIAAQLEKSWESALQRVQGCVARLTELDEAKPPPEQTPDFLSIAQDLESAWKASGVTMRSRQQMLSALIVDIVADSREIILTIHWRGGQYSQVRVCKPKTGEHGCRTSDEAIAVIQSMATRGPDDDIAATLNRMGMPTGHGRTRTAHRVSSLRRVRGIHAYRSADKAGE